MFRLNHRRLAAALALTAFMLATGCVERPEVTSYTVQNVAGERPPVAAARREPAAGGQAWFFKLLGKQQTVQAAADPFAQLMASVRFDASGAPTWETPAGWNERKESGLRFATLVQDGSEPPLEIAVSSLASDDPEGDAYLKSNIDRWRGQVGLEPYEGDDWKQRAEKAGEVREASTATGRFVLVQLNGKDKAGEAVTMLAAIVPRPASSGSVAPTAAPFATEDGATPTYTAPAEWTSAPPRQFQTALWKVSQGDQTLEVSLSQSGGSMEMNLQRWRTQVGPDPGGATEPAAESIMVGGAAGTRVELKGAEKTIVGVIVPQGGASWFFKMMGPAVLVEQERGRFDAFVASVKWP